MISYLTCIVITDNNTSKITSDNNNRMIQLTDVFCVLLSYNGTSYIWIQKAADSNIRDPIKRRGDVLTIKKIWATLARYGGFILGRCHFSLINQPPQNVSHIKKSQTWTKTVISRLLTMLIHAILLKNIFFQSSESFLFIYICHESSSLIII